MSEKNKKYSQNSIRSITFTAVTAALVFVFTYTFKIPFINGYTHLGDCMIFLAIVLIGYKKAAFAGGLGAALADLIGGYTAWVLPSFFIKFFMALICGFVMEKIIKSRHIVGYGVGSMLGGLFQIAAYTAVKVVLFDKAYALTSLPRLTLQTVFGIVAALVIIAVFDKTGVTAKLKKIMRKEQLDDEKN